MTQSLIDLGEHEDRVLTIVKGKYGFKNKSDAINFVIDKFEGEFLETEIRPEYTEKINQIQKEKGINFKNIQDLRKKIEDA